MIAVIQCAARKRSGAGHLVSAGGKPVVFVADPGAAPADTGSLFARPDDPSDWGMSWRQVLLNYNQETDNNPRGLYPAWQLYADRTYGRLVEQLGLQNVYILSAGWGLIRADFLTPYYDITFSPSARGPDSYKRRMKSERYQDFCMLTEEIDEAIVFFGGKEYIPLFCSLTASIRAKKTIFYNSAREPHGPGCAIQRFNTTKRTNWHYECANAFLQGTIVFD